ncbi:MAG: hypothetical protein AAFP97_09875 [Pseudomonadota bacterium]
MDIQAAQADIRRAYRGGGLGAIVSGLVWVMSGVVTLLHGINIGYLALFFGGMLIFPVSSFLERLILKNPSPDPDNPFGRLAFETVPPMIAMLIAVWFLIPHYPEWVFPFAAIAVGTHYFGFRSAYGMFTYWALAGVMTAVGAIAIWMVTIPAPTFIFIIAAIEIVFGFILIRQTKS